MPRPRTESDRQLESDHEQIITSLTADIQKYQDTGRNGYEIAMLLLQNTNHTLENVMAAFEAAGYTVLPTKSHVTKQPNGFRISQQPASELPSQKRPQKVIWQRRR